MAHTFLRRQNTHLGLARHADGLLYISNDLGDPPEPVE